MTAAGWSGVHVILITPFSVDGRRIDHQTLEAHVDRLCRAGIRFLVSGGNTSEYHALDRRERGAILATTVKASAGRATVVAGIGASVREAPAEARAAVRLGADAVMVHTPASPTLTGDGWLRYHDTIGRSIERPVLPYVRAATVTGGEVARLADRPYVAAVKYAVPDPIQFGSAVAAGDGSAAWICGLAESWAPAFRAMGGDGFTSGLANLRPDVSLRFAAALTAGDHARVLALWASLRPFEALRGRQGDGWNVAVVKRAMALAGHDVGPVRPPASELPAGLEAELEAAVASLGGA